MRNFSKATFLWRKSYPLIGLLATIGLAIVLFSVSGEVGRPLYADLKEWRKLQFELVGQEIPIKHTTDELRNTFSDPLTCFGCHPNHFNDWKQSYHAKSIQNPGFQTLYLKYLDYLKNQETKKALGRDTNVEDLRQCLFCHAPQVQFASDKLVQEISDSIATSNWEHIRGLSITCVVCHSITPEGKWSTDSFQIHGTLYGPLQDPVPAQFSQHQSQYSDLHTKSEFCGICHSAKPFNVYCSLVYDQYKQSPTAKEGTQCQDCHMETQTRVNEGIFVAVGEKSNRVKHSHLFAGGRFKEKWSEALDLDLRIEQNAAKDLVATVVMTSKVPHNMPDG